jgi:hypothetical protein
MSGANTLFSMLQQMGNAMGIAGTAILLRAAASVTHPEDAAVTVGDFHWAFWGIALAGAVGVWHFRTLAPDAGAALKAKKG